MKKFFADVADAFLEAGVPERQSRDMARLAISKIESPLISVSTFIECLTGLTGRYRSVIEAALGDSAKRLLIAPIPNYILPFLPDIIAEFPETILADNFKAGKTIADRTCVTLEDALADGEFDACLLATVDLRLGRMFRARLGPHRTIGAAELSWLDPARLPRPPRAEFAAFQKEILESVRPLIILTAYLDTTFGPTVEALSRHGFDIFVCTRHPFSDGNSHITASPERVGAKAYCATEFDEMLALLRQSGNCPVLVNYARFFASDWDLHNTLPLFAYNIAVLRAITGPALIHLYDAYQVGIHGIDAAPRSFILYRAMLDHADGIVVNADVAEILQDELGPEKPILSFLRYGPLVDVQTEPDGDAFSLVMITGILGEGGDPTRHTAAEVQCLLRQGIHFHYYSASQEARTFRDGLPDAEATFFHVHDPIRDQWKLVKELSRYHAGWFLAHMDCCETLNPHLPPGFARRLGAEFLPTTVGTAGMLYGCAGLPSFFISGHYTARLFPPGTAVEIDFEDVPRLRELISARDWVAMRQATIAARDRFSAERQINRLCSWLEQFYPAP